MSANSICQFFHWLPVIQQIKFKILLTTYKAVHNSVPSYIHKLISTYQPNYQFCSSQEHLLFCSLVTSSHAPSRVSQELLYSSGTPYHVHSFRFLNDPWKSSGRPIPHLDSNCFISLTPQCDTCTITYCIPLLLHCKHSQARPSDPLVWIVLQFFCFPLFCKVLHWYYTNA